MNRKDLVEIRVPAGGSGPSLTSAVFAPTRGMMLLQLKGFAPGIGEVELVACPDLDQALNRLEDSNAAFAFGGAILAPFANRVTGDLAGDFIETRVAGRKVRLPANWGGGGRRYAMHGLILGAEARDLVLTPSTAGASLVLDDDDAWPSRLEFRIAWRLAEKALSLDVISTNTGPEETAVGVGWHPYLALPGGRREEARLHVPFTGRAAIDDYDSVLPTGEIEDVASTEMDFSNLEGRVLGGTYLDDCFVRLRRDSQGAARAWVLDPKAGIRLCVGSDSPKVSAMQVYAPPDRAFVVIEPQFNLADPLGSVWRGRDTGLVRLPPGGSVSYSAYIGIEAA